MWRISRFGYSVAVVAGLAILLAASQTRVKAGQAAGASTLVERFGSALRSTSVLLNVASHFSSDAAVRLFVAVSNNSASARTMCSAHSATDHRSGPGLNAHC